MTTSAKKKAGRSSKHSSKSASKPRPPNRPASRPASRPGKRSSKKKAPQKKAKETKELEAPNRAARSQTYAGLAKEVWRAAQHHSQEVVRMKKLEAIGWAFLAAREAAESSIDKGEDLADCLNSAIKQLQEQVKTIQKEVKEQKKIDKHLRDSEESLTRYEQHESNSESSD